MTTNIAHFNGQLLPLDKITISPLDRGFIFGDGVYEVIPVYEGAMLRGREHFERLQRSMDEIRLENPHTVDEWIDRAGASSNQGSDPGGATLGPATASMSEELRNRIILYVLNSGNTVAPPCRKQAPFNVGGRTTDYPQVRETPKPAP